MKTKEFFITGIAIAGVFLSSCEERLDLTVESVDEKTETDQQAALEGHLETMYMMQSNPELILADRIISKSTGFVLDLSQKEAQELQISDEIYQKYVDKVNEFNEQAINQSK